MKIITPKGINIADYKAAIDKGLMAGVEDTKALFAMTYHNWEPENQPHFDVGGPKTKDGSRIVEYSTDDEPYVFVSNGTDGPYSITPKGAKGFLRFKTGGMPKTFPNKLQSTSGAPGTDWHTAKEVTHPGIDARNFPEEVVKRLVLVGVIQNEINEVV